MAGLKSDPRFHGRRSGRQLRTGQKALVRDLLPKISIIVPPPPTPPPTPSPTPPQVFFDQRYDAYWLEIGFGGGEHLAAQAMANPNVGILGAEPFINGVVTLLREVDQNALNNVRVLANDVRPLLECLPDGGLERIFVLFPDPWPKTRHHARRIINPASVAVFHRLLSATGELRIATDHRGYLSWILRHVLNHAGWKWCAESPDDWRRRPADWPPTRYEQKAIANGDAPSFLRFVKKSSDNREDQSE